MKKLLILLLVFTCVVNAQNKRISKADKHYQKFAYADALKEYLKVKKKEKNKEVMLKIANCYYYNSDYNNSFKYFDTYVNFFKTDIKDSLSNSHYKKLLKRSTDIVAPEYYKQAKEFNFDYEIIGVSKVIDKYLVSVNKPNTDDKVHHWSNKPFYNIYEASIDTTSSNIDLKGKYENINEYPFHTSNITVANNNKVVYFTRTVYSKNKDKEYTFLKLYCGKLDKGKLTEIYECLAPLNKGNYSYAHPFITKDNKMYFSSDKNGSSDLFYIQLNKQGYYSSSSSIVELKDLNSKNREDFPFVSENDNIYFASDNDQTIGGLDLFIAQKNEGKYFFQNMGAGINSKEDDFSIYTEKEDSTAYMISNRSTKDKLYQFKKVKDYFWKFKTKPFVYGIVKDSINNLLLRNARINLRNSKYKIIGQAKTDSLGYYAIEVPLHQETKISYEADDYSIIIYEPPVFNEVVLFEKNVNLYNERLIKIDEKLITLDDGMDLFKILNLKPIYFSYNGYNIAKPSKIQLDKIVSIMNLKPNMKLEITSHTDNKGSEKYNMNLSQNRANATVDYIKSKGIASERLKATPFGESKPIHDCGKNCTPEQDAENRRSAFLVKF